MDPAVPARPGRPRSEVSRATLAGIAAVALALILVLWAGAIGWTRAEREQAVAAEAAKNDNLAVAHEERTARSIEVVDTLLRFVRADYLNTGSAVGLSQRLASMGPEARFIHVLTVLGPRGEVVASSVEIPPGTSFEDRAYFRQHRERAEDELLVGPPILGRVTGKPVISITRRIEQPGGGFGGVVFLSMDPAFFSRLYERSSNGANGALALIGMDGITRVRRNGDKVSHGEDIRKSQLFKELPKASAGHYIANAASDGVLRAVSYRKLEGLPLVVVVASSLDEVLAASAARSRTMLIATTLSSLLILVVAGLLMSGVRRRALALAAVEDSERRYRLLFEKNLDALLRTSADGAVLAANAAACQLFGADETTLRGLSPDRIFAPDDPRFQPLIDGLRATGQARGALRLQRADGQSFEAELSANTYIDCDGQKVVSVVVRDLSERIADDAARSTLEAQLRESQKLESLGTLAGGIAHDFNNILGAILGNVALAATELPERSPVQTPLLRIRQATHRARDLVHQILTFSRRNLHSRSVQDVRAILEEALALLRATLPAGIELVLHSDEAPMRVSVDAGQIQQVLMNLGVNAWHAMAGAHGRIEITAKAVAAGLAPRASPSPRPPGRCVEIAVRDNGIGMDDAVRARIFEPFFTTKPVGKGTGLGLSVVHGIVQAHHGAITVDSRPGDGTTFRILLPLVDEAVAAAVPEPGTPMVLSRQGNGERIVFVDDDEMMRLMAERLLATKGYAPRCFDAPEAALAAFRIDPRAGDLVITDFEMPGSNGLELAQALAVLVPAVPVIISSGYIDDALREDARQAGVRAVLHKETMLDTLGGELQRILHADPAAA